MTSLVARQVEIADRLGPTDLDVDSGELVALVGPNGGGKTSRRRALARIETSAGAGRRMADAIRHASQTSAGIGSSSWLPSPERQRSASVPSGRT